MNDVLSVLVIIGSAVIGPIEARTDFDAKGATAECFGTHGRSSEYCLNIYPEYVRRKSAHETLPELCERAMRGVGASKWYRYEKSKKHPNGLITSELLERDNGPGSLPPEVNWTLPETEYEKHMHKDHAKQLRTWHGYSAEFEYFSVYWGGPVVRCIPAPTGLRGK